MSILSRALRDRFSSPPRKSASRRVSIHVLELESRRLLTGVLGWSGGVNLPGGETQVSAVTVGSNSSILLFGNGGSAVKQLNPGASAWTTAGPIDVPRNAPGAVELDNTGQLIVFGGYSPNDGSATDGVMLPALSRSSPRSTPLASNSRTQPTARSPTRSAASTRMAACSTAWSSMTQPRISGTTSPPCQWLSTARREFTTAWATFT